MHCSVSEKSITLDTGVLSVSSPHTEHGDGEQEFF